MERWSGKVVWFNLIKQAVRVSDWRRVWLWHGKMDRSFRTTSWWSPQARVGSTMRSTETMWWIKRVGSLIHLLSDSIRGAARPKIAMNLASTIDKRGPRSNRLILNPWLLLAWTIITYPNLTITTFQHPNILDKCRWSRWRLWTREIVPITIQSNIILQSNSLLKTIRILTTLLLKPCRPLTHTKPWAIQRLGTLRGLSNIRKSNKYLLCNKTTINSRPWKGNRGFRCRKL